LIERRGEMARLAPVNTFFNALCDINCFPVVSKITGSSEYDLHTQLPDRLPIQSRRDHPEA
jgi:hypothetical protein